jgi:Restriction endonuclease
MAKLPAPRNFAPAPRPPAPIPDPDRPGQAFQNTVAMVERAIAGQDGVQMETNVRVKDADGDLREHDILITHTEGLRVTRTAVECKDHGRKIGKPELEAFRSKCADTGIHKGVIVSSSGFAKSALKASRRTNVQCLELAKVDSFPWVGASGSIVTERHFSNIDVNVFALTKIEQPFKIFAMNDAELTMENYRNVCQIAINKDEDLSKLGRDGSVCVMIQWKPEDGVYVIDANAIRHEIEFLELRPTFTTTETHQAFELHSYFGDTGKLEVASSDFEAGGLTAKLVMIRDEKNIHVMLQPLAWDGEPLKE